VTEKITFFYGGKPACPLPITIIDGKVRPRAVQEGALIASPIASSQSRVTPTLRLTRKDVLFLKAVGISVDEYELMSSTDKHVLSKRAGEYTPMNKIEIRKNVDALVAQKWAGSGVTAAAALVADPTFREAASAAIEGELANQKRRGTPGFHCFFCGEIVGKTVRCDCGFGESFGCGGLLRHVCDGCVAAHKAVSEHLRKTFSFPIVMRANSRRAQHERALFEAANQVCGADADNYDADTRNLVFYLAQADAFYDTKSEFRRKILDAFNRSGFLDFKALAKALEKEEEAAFVRALVRANPAWRRAQRQQITEQLRGMADEQFYK
jgi:hypothetical protein